MPKGCIESQALVVPAGGWALSITDDSGGPYAVTVPAGTYSPTTLCAAVVTVCDAASGQTYTCSFTVSETTATPGQVAFRPDGATFAATFTSTDLRDVLGFAGNLANMAAAANGSTYGVKGLWLPDAPYLSPYGSADPGHTEGGPTQTVSPLGQTKTLVRPTRVKMPSIRWSHISAARARQAAESGAPRSFERFVRETMFGAVSYFRPGGAWRFYWNADSLGSYQDFNPIAPRTTAMDAADPQWRGLYSVEFGGWAV